MRRAVATSGRWRDGWTGGLMVSHDARPAVRSAIRLRAYTPGPTPLLPRVHRGLQGPAGLLTRVVVGLGLGLRSHDRGPTTVGAGVARGTRPRSVERGVTGPIRDRRTCGESDAARVGGPGWLGASRRAVVTAAQNQITVKGQTTVQFRPVERCSHAAGQRPGHE